MTSGRPSSGWRHVKGRTVDPRTTPAITFLANETTAGEVAASLSSIAAVDVQGTPETRIAGLSTSAAAVQNSLSYLSIDYEQLRNTNIERTVICSPDTCRYTAAAAKIIVADPRAAFMSLLRRLLDEAGLDMERTVAAQATGVEAGDFEAHASAIVEQPVIIGSGVYLGPNVVIAKGTILGKGTIVGTGSVIGAAGRALHKCADGSTLSWNKLHVGIVHIGGGCEIGANTVINRAMLGQTRIGKDTVIGNLVHIGHGATIGDRVWIASHSVVLGHATVGSGATVGAHAVIRDNVDVGQNAAIGMGSVVVANVAPDESVLGNPAKPVRRRLQPGPER